LVGGIRPIGIQTGEHSITRDRIYAEAQSLWATYLERLARDKSYDPGIYAALEGQENTLKERVKELKRESEELKKAEDRKIDPLKEWALRDQGRKLRLERTLYNGTREEYGIVGNDTTRRVMPVAEAWIHLYRDHGKKAIGIDHWVLECKIMVARYGQGQRYKAEMRLGSGNLQELLEAAQEWLDTNVAKELKRSGVQ
jgi:hypothetical protein